jgi:hypothetical protein
MGHRSLDSGLTSPGSTSHVAQQLAGLSIFEQGNVSENDQSWSLASQFLLCTGFKIP